MTTENGYVLIVGGAGYVGSHVNKVLYKLGYRTICLDNLVYGHSKFVKNGIFIPCDLSDLTELELVFKSYNIDAVMHFAAFAYVGESVKKPDKYYTNNVSNTLNLLNTMLKFNIKKFIFSSTCAIYGNPEYIPIDENHPKKPINPYGKSKLMIEEILEDYAKAYDFNYVSLRYFNVAGADFDAEIGEKHIPETHIIPLLLDVALGKREYFTIFGNTYETKDGTCIRDYIHVLDLAEAHVRAYEWLNKNKKSEFFNLGTGKGYTVLEIINTIEKITENKIGYRIGNPREGDPPILIASNKKAQEILEFSCKYSDIEDIVNSAYRWHIKNL
jgi:UDP-glucose 4-epimerase